VNWLIHNTLIKISWIKVSSMSFVCKHQYRFWSGNSIRCPTHEPGYPIESNMCGSNMYVITTAGIYEFTYGFYLSLENTPVISSSVRPTYDKYAGLSYRCRAERSCWHPHRPHLCQRRTHSAPVLATHVNSYSYYSNRCLIASDPAGRWRNMFASAASCNIGRSSQ
jgi:hypothetical protein